MLSKNFPRQSLYFLYKEVEIIYNIETDLIDFFSSWCSCIRQEID